MSHTASQQIIMEPLESLIKTQIAQHTHDRFRHSARARTVAAGRGARAPFSPPLALNTLIYILAVSAL